VRSVVRIYPGPPCFFTDGAVAQLGEHSLCKRGVTGSIPVSSTNLSTFEMSLYKDGSPDKALDPCTAMCKAPQGAHRLRLMPRMFDNEIDWVKHYKAEQYSRLLFVMRGRSNVQVECL
jgi:hypothetical protein